MTPRHVMTAAITLASLGCGRGKSAEPSHSSTVPMEVRDGRGFVEVMLNGRGPYRLAVETGSPNVVLSRGLVESLGLPAQPSSGADPTFRLDSLRIGATLVRGLAVGAENFGHPGAEGVLGLDASADLLLTIDYPGKKLTLVPGSLPEPDGREVLRAVRVGPFIGVEIDMGGVKETGVIDTQGGITFQALPEVAERLTFEKPLRVVGMAVVGGGAPVEVRGGRLAGDLTIGRHVFRHAQIAVHTLPPDIPSRVTIGIGALRQFAITLDQRSMAVRFARADTSATVLAGER